MPAGTPVRETLLANLETTLRAIDGESDYYNNFEDNSRVQRVLPSFPPTESPFLYIEDLGDTPIEEAVKAAYTLTKANLNFRIWMFSQHVEPSTRATTQNKLLHDISKKLLVNDTIRTASGNAINTYIIGVDQPEIDETIAPWYVASVRGYYQYQYRTNDPTQKV